MIEVRAYATRKRAELAQAALVTAGVASRLVAADAGRALPFAVKGRVRLLVDEANAEFAAAILGEGCPR